MLVEKSKEMSLPLCHYMEAHSPNILTIAERETKHCLSSDVLQIVPNIYLSGHNLCYWTLERMEVYGFTHIIAIDQIDSTLPDGRNQFVGDSNFGNFLRQSGHLLDLCFCEGAYLTTVLPNCYKAVKFIERSMRGNARILVIDGSGFHRCVTIIVGFIMYKHKMNFIDSYSKVKEHCPYVDLDQYFARQLYEYEKILEVQRSQARGHSCSGELRSAQLKRKRTME